jgi:hypothetical protein
MQVNNDYIDGLFARKLGNTEVSPPHDGWLRIESELSRRSRLTRRFWLTAASFALVMSVTATVVYLQTDSAANRGTVAFVRETASPQNKQPLSTAHHKIDDTQQATEKADVARQGENSATTRSTAGTSPASVEATALTAERNTASLETVEIPGRPTVEQNVMMASKVGEIAKTPSNIPVYSDSWGEMLRAQPIKANRLGTRLNKLTQLKLRTAEKKKDKAITAATLSTPVYDDITSVGVAVKSNSFTASPPPNRWEIAGQFAPMYSYRAISSVPNGTNKSDFDNAESPLLVYSGGITVAYRVFNRLSVQTGMFYSQMGQSINSVTPIANMYVTLSSNNAYNKNFVKTSTGNVTVASNVKSEANPAYASYFNTASQSASANTVAAANASNPAKYKMIERLDYLEIPLLLHYRVIDRKLNFYVLGGVSANILINNNVFVDNGSELVKGGSILMARPANYSATFGLGLGYQVTGNLSVGFEPSFKYYLQSYASSQIVSNPYAFGFFTNIYYHF